jgi:hypothetical protein
MQLAGQRFIVAVHLLAPLLLGAAPWARAQAQASSELDTQWAVEEGYSLRVLAKGFSLPTSLAAVPRPAAEPRAPKLFVAELRGRIKVLANDNSVSEFASIATFAPKKDWPDGEGEAGMAGICLDPEHGYVFVTYAYRDASRILRNGISRLRVEPITFTGKVQEQVELGRFLAGEPSSLSHQIGNCAVHGGFLYVSIGDAGYPALTTRPDSSLGKVLRLTLDGEPAPGNPMAGSGPIAPRVFAMGLRNPFGLAFAGDRLFAAENGLDVDRFMEIGAGRNYLWDGTDASIATNAAAVFVPTIGPVQMAHVPPGANALSPSEQDRFLISASDSHQGPGIVSVEYSLRSSTVASPPRYLVHYEGPQKRMAVTGVAITRDGVAFVPILPVDKTGVVLVAKYEPSAAHHSIIGKTAAKGSLVAANGCLGCHSLGGVGGHIGPDLDTQSVRSRVETRVLDAAYRQHVEQLDALKDAVVAQGRKARHEVLDAPADERVRTWVVNRLLNPKFDQPDAQMPQLNLSREKAEAIATELLGVGTWERRLHDVKFLSGAAAGALAMAMAMAMIASIVLVVLYRRPLKRALLRARPRG